MRVLIVLILIILFLLSTTQGSNGEHFGDSQGGALIQLMAKGPQDTYLTGDAWKYIPPWYYNMWWDPYYRPSRYSYYPYRYY